MDLILLIVGKRSVDTGKIPVYKMLFVVPYVRRKNKEIYL